MILKVNINALIISQIVLTLLVIVLLFIIIRFFYSFKFEKRFSKYSLSPKKENTVSFFDKFFNLLWNFIYKIGDLFAKSKSWLDYSKKYEKHITYEQKEIIRPVDYIAIKIVIAFTLLILSLLTYIIRAKVFTIWTILAIIIFGFYLPDLILQIRYNNKRKCVKEDLLKAIIIMNNAFKSGMNILEASTIVRDELSGPISDEFKKICVDLNYGLSLETVFNRFYERVKLEDAKYITSSLTLLNKTGGNIVKVFSMIESSFFDKKKLRNELRSMTTQSIFVYRLLVTLPIIFSLVIYLLNPSYFAPFFASPLGILIFGVILIIYFAYIILIRKVLEVKI